MRRYRCHRYQECPARALRRGRQVIVEPAFGILKQAEGFRRWTVRGLENVRTQWALVCAAYNLKKLCKAWKKDFAAAGTFRTRLAPAALALGVSLLLSRPSLKLGF